MSVNNHNLDVTDILEALRGCVNNIYALQDDVKNKILDASGNPKITKIGDSAFVMSSKDLRIDSWSPFAYNWKSQQDALASIIDMSIDRPSYVSETLTSILEKKSFYRNREKLSFSPEFVEKVKPYLEISIKLTSEMSRLMTPRTVSEKSISLGA